MNQPAGHKTPKAAMKRSGVKELVEALRSAGVSADDIVIDRAPDGSVRVYKRAPIKRAQMSDLDRWAAGGDYAA